MGEPMDYDAYAREYADTRWPFPWVLEPLERCVANTKQGASILEVGCGTGNYVITLADRFPDRAFFGFDLSREMLSIARTRTQSVAFARAHAEEPFPYFSQSFDLVFCVDVLHHLSHLNRVFAESARVLKQNGSLTMVTDSEQNVRSRSLTRFFPEILDLELQRYPKLQNVRAAARSAGLAFVGSQPAEGHVELDDEFIRKLERKCSSAMRLISREAHDRGVRRVREAQRHGEQWLSCYTVLHFRLTEVEPA